MPAQFVAQVCQDRDLGLFQASSSQRQVFALGDRAEEKSQIFRNLDLQNVEEQITNQMKYLILLRNPKYLVLLVHPLFRPRWVDAIDRALLRLLRGKPYRPFQHKTTVT